MTEKEKKQEGGDTDRTIILFLYPLIFDTKIPRDYRNSIIVPSVSPLVSFLFLSFLIPCSFN